MYSMQQVITERATKAAPYDHPLVRKLESFVRLNAAEERALKDAAASSRRLAARKELAAGVGLVVVLSGFACRVRLLADGRRQVVALLLPGDFCQLGVRTDQAIVAISQTTVSLIPSGVLASLASAHPRIADAIEQSRLLDEAVCREWLVNLGLRTAFERTGSLLLEIHLRLRAAGLAQFGECDFPLTQADLAEALGLSPVHVNRTLQALRQKGLIRLTNRRLAVPDPGALAAASLFDPAYLQGPRRARIADMAAAE
jgi:CRP-like cAMP-binding protein